MTDLIRKLLLQFIEDIDNGSCNMTYDEQCRVMLLLGNIYNGDERFSKAQASEYLGICRATFDNYVKLGILPKGVKQDGFKLLYWYKSDLDLYRESHNVTLE